MKVEVHTFWMGDVEDPEIYVAEPLYEWQQTDFGKWCLENSSDLVYHISMDMERFGYRVTITGEFKDKHLSYILLKKS